MAAASYLFDDQLKDWEMYKVHFIAYLADHGYDDMISECVSHRVQFRTLSPNQDCE
jgi:hypothetical protein